MSAPFRLVTLVLWLLTTAAGSRGAEPAIAPMTRGGKDVPPRREPCQIAVTSHGWHTGVVVRRRDLLHAGTCPPLPPFARDEFLEFGWGSAPFYTAPRPTLAIALRTVFTATPSVLHVVGFHGPAVMAFSQSEVVVVPVTEAGLRGICAELGETFARDAHGRAMDRGPGLYGHSHFFAARGRYSLAGNCNGWTARVLHAGGLPVRPGLSTLSAGGLMAQVRLLGSHRRVAGGSEKTPAARRKSRHLENDRPATAARRSKTIAPR